MELAIIVIGILYILSLIWNIFSKENRWCPALIMSMLAVLFVTFIGAYNNRNKPTPIEVYQGKTTLQITYEDSIPVDSVVVYKPEFRK